MTDPQYSIVVCHYNMAATVETSIKSILTQIDSGFEVVVIDGGSDDGSLRILRRLSNEYSALRVFCTAKTGRKGLGAERNIGVEEARGKHVLLQLDADDRYEPVINDFVYVYKCIQDGLNRDIYVSGRNINAAPREFLLSYGPYREGIHRGEDTDMWRRMIVDNAFIQLEHEDLCKSLGYDPGKCELVNKRLSEIEGDLRSGVSAVTRWRRAFGVPDWRIALLESILVPIAWLKTLQGPSYSLPDDWGDRNISAYIEQKAVTVPEIDGAGNITIDYDELSEVGRSIFVTPYLE